MKFSKTIWISIKYGLSNKKGGIGGTALKTYTLFWTIYAILFTIIPLFILDYDLISLFAYSILLLVFVLPLYVPIYFAWYSFKKQQEKSVIKQDELRNNLNVPGNTTQENKKLADNDFKIKKTQDAAIISKSNVSTIFHNQFNGSSKIKDIIKSMDKILQNENVIDAIRGDKKTDKSQDIMPSTFVLTPSRIIFYKKSYFGGYKSIDYPIKSINGITFNHGLLSDGIKLHTKIENFEIKNISQTDRAEDFVTKVKSCMASYFLQTYTPENDLKFNKLISRETEFYQGFIRLKISITNTTDFVINDVSLDFHFDEILLRIDRHEPDYPIKNEKILLGNINNGSSKSVAVYFDPMMCSRGTEINCQINYSNEKGQIQTIWMEPKMINVVCPIMKTDSDINIGRLKEFVEKLPHSDCKIYQIQTGFNIDPLKTISREVIQKHDVKHIRTLYTKDGKTCETWYYGNTKVNNHNIVIRITISSENKSLELFAATQTAESLTGLLAELGRELFTSIEAKITGKNNVNQVINVSIKDSIIQRSNLLSYCDIDGKCTGDVVLEDSLVQRSNIEFDTHIHDIQKNQLNNNLCPDCGEKLPENAKFCLECGGKVNLIS